MTTRLAATLAALVGALGVILGAFGAHALKTRLDPAQLQTFETAVRYQMYHVFAMLAAAWLISRNAPGAGAAAWSFLIGITIFSGSLYGYVATGQRWMAIVTPLGGLAMIVGWLLLAKAGWSIQE